MKPCKACGIEKELDEFHNHHKQKDGKRSKCKACRKISGMSYYETNKQKILKSSADYYDRNSVRIIAHNQAYARVIAHNRAYARVKCEEVAVVPATNLKVTTPARGLVHRCLDQPCRASTPGQGGLRSRLRSSSMP